MLGLRELSKAERGATRGLGIISVAVGGVLAGINVFAPLDESGQQRQMAVQTRWHQSIRRGRES